MQPRLPARALDRRNFQYKLTAYQLVGGSFTLVPPFSNAAGDANLKTHQLEPPKTVFGLGRQHVQRRASFHKRVAAHKKAAASRHKTKQK